MTSEIGVTNSDIVILNENGEPYYSQASRDQENKADE